MRKRVGGLVVAVCIAGAPGVRPADGAHLRGGRAPAVFATAGAGHALAQEGHPLSGTWGGEWATAAATRTHLTVVMAWDGKTVTGIINPGPDAIPLTNVSVNWSTWTLRLEGQAKDASGKPVDVSADGRLEDIGSYRRKIIGTWTQDGATGEFLLTRE